MILSYKKQLFQRNTTQFLGNPLRLKVLCTTSKLSRDCLTQMNGGSTK